MLEVNKTSTLGLIIVCRECKHVESQETPDVWIDTNGDVYYQGDSKETLAAFIFHHG